MKKYVLIGPPGSGKGTQATLLAAAFAYAHYSTGDELRRAVADGSALGATVGGYLTRGELVPDAVMRDVVAAFLGRVTGPGIVFDGYPRTLAQARDLTELLGANRLTRVFVLELDHAEVVRRLTARRSCRQCGAVYNLNSQPPRTPDVCDRCQSPLTVRSDDEPATIERRLAVYEEQTAPLRAYYQDQGLLARIPGLGTIDEVQARIRAAQ